jgi:hypothetical protein
LPKDVVVLILARLAEMVRFDELHRLAVVSKQFCSVLRDRPDVYNRMLGVTQRLQLNVIIPRLMRGLDNCGEVFFCPVRFWDWNWACPLPFSLTELLTGNISISPRPDQVLLAVHGRLRVFKEYDCVQIERNGVEICAFRLPKVRTVLFYI